MLKGGLFRKNLAGYESARFLSLCETYVVVNFNFIDLMKLQNVETLIFLVPASNHFMF